MRGPLVSTYTEEEDRPTMVQSAASAPAPQAPAARDRGTLIRLDGAGAGQALSLPKTTVRVGRHRDAELRVDDDGVSRFHAAIHYEGGAYVLVDLGSRNGTYVAGQRVGRHTLAEADLVHFGPRTAFRFMQVDPAQQALLADLYEAGMRDRLTGAYNRRHFEERLQTEIAYAVRHRTEVSLLLFDIDHFKRVNDSFGHPAGDVVLRAISAQVACRLRAEDVFARWGGEEFAVLLRGIDLVGAARAGERLRAAVAAARPSFEGTVVPVHVSVGCASLSCSERRTGEALVSIADRRLYLAKRGGRNRVQAAG